MDLGIQYFECNDCGTMIYPQALISARAEKEYVRKIAFPPAHDKVNAESLLSKDTYDEIQAGLRDDEPNWVRFKGKTYGECIATLRQEYKVRRDATLIVLRADADKDENELKNNASSVSRTEAKDGITITADRFECVIEGIEKEGRAICPRCGRELCSWRHG